MRGVRNLIRLLVSRANARMPVKKKKSGERRVENRERERKRSSERVRERVIYKGLKEVDITEYEEEEEE